MPIINKKILTHLAELARLELTEVESKKYLKDLKNIFEYFKDLQTVDTSAIMPMTGGTFAHDVFRDDVVDFDKKSKSTDSEGRIIDEFPKTERGYLKVPKVFE